MLTCAECGAEVGDECRFCPQCGSPFKKRDASAELKGRDSTDTGTGAPAQPSEPLPFDKLGAYQVVKLLGRGGMGVVYEGFDESLHRRVALKVLVPEHSEDASNVQRFITEAQAVARINHANVVQIFFAGSDADVNFFVMEFIEGQSLDKVVEKDGPMAPLRAIQYLIQTVHGLDAAFQQGIIHRDIKPANLMLSSEDVVKVTDFGLARDAVEASGLTPTGFVVGTPFFLSPEQGQGRRVDHRTDIYSLGASLYCLLTGQVPFMADNSVGVVLKHVNEPVPKIRGAPPSLTRILEKMMAKDREDRQADYGELLSELVVIERGGTLRKKPLEPAGQKVSAIADSAVLRSLELVFQSDEERIETIRPTKWREADGLSSSEQRLMDSLDNLFSSDR